MKLDATFSVRFVHRLRCTRHVFNPSNLTLAELLEPYNDSPARALFFLDAGLELAQPTLAVDITRYVAAHADTIIAAGAVERVAGGEAAKNNPRNLEPMLRAIAEAHLCRRSYVLAVGGGAVLDAVGFAAAMAHRGVRLVRIASTTLAQSDSAMGVKNGINAFGKKNYLGVFTPPWAVINDEAMLQTLPDHEWISGFTEAVKVALLKDAALFDRIAANVQLIRGRDMSAAVPVIRRSAQLHLEHITSSGDPFELTASRPLDFGHWAAHKLEQMSDYSLHHGHAVTLGQALDLVYCNLMGWLSDADLSHILDCFTALGFALYHPLMTDAATLLQGLDEFREHLGGALTVPMLRAIGQPFDVHAIDRPRMCAALRQLQQHASHPPPVCP